MYTSTESINSLCSLTKTGTRYVPQASTAHDTFWDFVANNQESAHMIMWTMSDRAITRSFRMMEGFGVHTFRLMIKTH